MAFGTDVLIVVDIDARDNPMLCEFGCSPLEDRSWLPGQRQDGGLRYLIEPSGRKIPSELDIRAFTIASEPDCQSLSAYFRDLVARLREVAGDLLSAPDRVVAILLNLMPYYLSTTRFDKIAQGLFAGPASPLKGLSVPLVFMLRNLDWVQRSSVFQQLRANNSIQGDVIAVDVRGFGAVFRSDKAAKPFEVPRHAFRRILAIEPNRMYRSLVFGTNAYIGHYALANSHVRTHYDLEEFIKRDNVWEYLYGLLEEMVHGVERLMVIGAGLEEAVVLRIGEQLISILGERYSVAFRRLTTPESALRIRDDWSSQFDMAIVMSDIVNSGKTMEPFLARLIAMNKLSKPVCAFAVTKMRNSPQYIEGIPLVAGIEIRRDYYPPSETSCPLCQIGQPLMNVKTAEDFRHIQEGQMTPFDFWEMVRECKALVQGKPDPQGRMFSYRVETPRVVKDYSNWLCNVIAAVFARNWPNCRPEAICTVAEDSGRSFAGLVSRALGIPTVVSVERQVLLRTTPSAGLPSDVPNPLRGFTQVLLVDDGMNFGKTMESLISFCTVATGASPLGALVLDSRLSEQKIGKIRAQMARRPLIPLYSWPAPQAAETM